MLVYSADRTFLEAHLYSHHHFVVSEDASAKTATKLGKCCFVV
jgi:hypothetical protein